jgi:hypothetical protein
MSPVNIVLIAVFALGGGFLNSVLGWVKSDPPEPFNVRKFAASMIANIFGAAVITTGFDFSGISNIWLACIGALMAGAGVVSAAKNVAGAYTMKGTK